MVPVHFNDSDEDSVVLKRWCLLLKDVFASVLRSLCCPQAEAPDLAAFCWRRTLTFILSSKN